MNTKSKMLEAAVAEEEIALAEAALAAAEKALLAAEGEEDYDEYRQYQKAIWTKLAVNAEARLAALELEVSEQIKASEEMAQYTAFDEDDED